MIKKFLNNDYALYILSLHVGIGLLATLNKFAFIAWFFMVLLVEVPNLLNPQERLNVVITRLLIYIVSFEILARMIRSAPIIPHEMSKYLLFVLFSYGILRGYNKGTIGIFLLC